MTTLTGIGDTIRGERIQCSYRRASREILVDGSHKHRGRRVIIEGLPYAEARILKAVRWLKEKH